jgi:hypothetical protein
MKGIPEGRRIECCSGQVTGTMCVRPLLTGSATTFSFRSLIATENSRVDFALSCDRRLQLRQRAVKNTASLIRGNVCFCGSQAISSCALNSAPTSTA